MELLLWLWSLISLLWCDRDIARLRHPAYPERQAAENRLRDSGWLAYPVLDAARESRSPEVQSRADRVVAVYDRRADLFRAGWVLASPHEPDAEALWRDHDTRRALWLIAGLVPGVSDSERANLLPEHDPGVVGGWWWSDKHAWGWFEDAVKHVRTRLRSPP